MCLSTKRKICTDVMHNMVSAFNQRLVGNGCKREEKFLKSKCTFTQRRLIADLFVSLPTNKLLRHYVLVERKQQRLFSRLMSHPLATNQTCCHSGICVQMYGVKVKKVDRKRNTQVKNSNRIFVFSHFPPLVTAHSLMLFILMMS